MTRTNATTRWRSTSLAGMAAALATGLVLAQDSRPASRPAAPPLQRLEWLSGAWHRSQGERQAEEQWTTPRAGSMLGVSRSIKGRRTVFYEYLRIEDRGQEGVFYVALPKGAAQEIAFKLTKQEDRRVVFENPAHDFPRRITYWLEEVEGKPVLRAEIDDGSGKKTVGFRFQRGAL